MTLFNLSLNPPYANLFRFRLSYNIITLLVLFSLVLPGCIHINVTGGSADSRDGEEQAHYQGSTGNDQNPMSPGQSVEPLSGDPIGIPSALSSGNECVLNNLFNHRQETGSWCWAASTLTAFEFIGKRPHVDDDQCNFVNAVFSKEIEDENKTRTGNSMVNCCKAKRDVPHGTPGADRSEEICDQGLWPHVALNTLGAGFLKISYPPLDDLQGWEDLTGQICRGLPYLTVVKWAGGGRHAVAIGGYSSPPGEGEYVHVYDPGQQGFYVMLFQDFYNGIRGKFVHERDYFNIGQ